MNARRYATGFGAEWGDHPRPSPYQSGRPRDFQRIPNRRAASGHSGPRAIMLSFLETVRWWFTCTAMLPLRSENTRFSQTIKDRDLRGSVVLPIPGFDGTASGSAWRARRQRSVAKFSQTVERFARASLRAQTVMTLREHLSSAGSPYIKDA